ncbi:MAG TPA: hypothetical protein VKT29_03755 [Terriglobales bacterium]|nr:hypothetical protein [Terriglobales bacterium]
MGLNAALVLTTIADPVLLQGYYDNFVRHGHLHQVRVYVIPDRKTPAAAYERCHRLRQRGLEIVCPSLPEQEAYLKRIGFPPELVPYDSDNRRNVGYLMALDGDNDFVISIDDDNYCVPEEDFFVAHATVCGPLGEESVVESESGWFNVCDLLQVHPPQTVYARGFPYFGRHQAVRLSQQRQPACVRINAGLWLSEPDLDGMSWLVSPVRTTGFCGHSVVLGANTWSPVNTQNTALQREALAAYYFVRMGHALAGANIDRYGDIFSGYFSQACARHLGHAVRVGTPLADHRRNSHNYLRDASQELACICMLEDVLAWLSRAASAGHQLQRDLRFTQLRTGRGSASFSRSRVERRRRSVLPRGGVLHAQVGAGLPASHLAAFSCHPQPAVIPW